MYSDQDIAKKTEELVEDCRDFLDDQFRFRGAQYDAGLAMVHFPEGYGGLGGDRGQQASSTTSSGPTGSPTRTCASTRSASAWAPRRCWPTAPTS